VRQRNLVVTRGHGERHQHGGGSDCGLVRHRMHHIRLEHGQL
jgi:hypothetical protein